MAGIDIDGSYGYLDGSLLLIAARESDYDLFITLINKGASIDYKSVKDIDTVDAIFTWTKDLRFYVFLRSHGINLDKICFNGATPLSLAVSKLGHNKNNSEIYPELERIYEYLIDNKVDINSNGNEKLSPLLIAARMGLYEITADLLRRGASKTQKYRVDELDNEYTCIEYVENINKKEPVDNYEKILPLLR